MYKLQNSWNICFLCSVAVSELQEADEIKVSTESYSAADNGQHCHLVFGGVITVQDK